MFQALLDRARRGWELFRTWTPITLAGALMLGGSLFALIEFGIGRLDHILLVAGALGIGIFVVSLVFCAFATWRLWKHQGRFAPTKLSELESTYPSRTGFSVPAMTWIPFVAIDWIWEAPEAEVRRVYRSGRWVEDVVPTRRGICENIVRRFEIRDIFGLVRFRFRYTEDRPIRVVPSVGKLRQMHLIQGMSGGADLSHPEGSPTGDRIDMRHYAPGDPIRFVLWKVFAKSRDLMIRTPERAISPTQQTVAYLVTGERDEPAAGACRVAVDNGSLGHDWLLGADGTTEVAETLPLALEILARSSAVAQNDGGAGLASFLQKSSPTKMKRAVVFVPARPGPWLDRVMAATGGADSLSRLDVVVCTDGIKDTPPPEGWRKWMLRDDDRKVTADGTATADVAEVVKRLKPTASSIVLVDRAEGQLYSPAHLDRMAS